jgi:hypothetical protein
MAEITGVLSVNNALVPQDIEITPTNEEVTVTADEGHYIRSVTVKAIPSDSQEENDNGNTGEEGTQEP